MMLAGGGLRVVLLTIHVALKDVPSLLSPSAILESLRMIASFSAGVGLYHPRIAVCGLNPHAGEDGRVAGGLEQHPEHERQASGDERDEGVAWRRWMIAEGVELHLSAEAQAQISADAIASAIELLRSATSGRR